VSWCSGGLTALHFGSADFSLFVNVQLKNLALIELVQEVRRVF
jgi:hypothetical protein